MPPIIDTILAREYVFKKGNALVPTWVAFAVAQLLSDHLPNLVDYKFTAQMEDDLDSISRGESGHLDYLRGIPSATAMPGSSDCCKTSPRKSMPVTLVILIGRPEGRADFRSGGPVWAVLGAGRTPGGLREEMAPDELSIDFALELLNQAELSEQPLGHCPQTGKPVYLETGRFGPYVQRGNIEDEEKPKNASLLKGLAPEGCGRFSLRRDRLGVPANWDYQTESLAATMAASARTSSRGRKLAVCRPACRHST